MTACFLRLYESSPDDISYMAGGSCCLTSDKCLGWERSCPNRGAGRRVRGGARRRSQARRRTLTILSHSCYMGTRTAGFLKNIKIVYAANFLAVVTEVEDERALNIRYGNINLHAMSYGLAPSRNRPSFLVRNVSCDLEHLQKMLGAMCASSRAHTESDKKHVSLARRRKIENAVPSMALLFTAIRVVFFAVVGEAIPALRGQREQAYPEAVWCMSWHACTSVAAVAFVEFAAAAVVAVAAAVVAVIAAFAAAGTLRLFAVAAVDSDKPATVQPAAVAVIGTDVEIAAAIAVDILQEERRLVAAAAAAAAVAEQRRLDGHRTSKPRPPSTSWHSAAAQKQVAVAEEAAAVAAHCPSAGARNFQAVERIQSYEHLDLSWEALMIVEPLGTAKTRRRVKMSCGRQQLMSSETIVCCRQLVGAASREHHRAVWVEVFRDQNKLKTLEKQKLGTWRRNCPVASFDIPVLVEIRRLVVSDGFVVDSGLAERHKIFLSRQLTDKKEKNMESRHHDITSERKDCRYLRGHVPDWSAGSSKRSGQDPKESFLLGASGSPRVGECCVRGSFDTPLPRPEIFPTLDIPGATLPAACPVHSAATDRPSRCSPLGRLDGAPGHMSCRGLGRGVAADWLIHWGTRPAAALARTRASRTSVSNKILSAIGTRRRECLKLEFHVEAYRYYWFRHSYGRLDYAGKGWKIKERPVWRLARRWMNHVGRIVGCQQHSMYVQRSNARQRNIGMADLLDDNNQRQISNVPKQKRAVAVQLPLELTLKESTWDGSRTLLTPSVPRTTDTTGTGELCLRQEARSHLDRHVGFRDQAGQKFCYISPLGHQVWRSKKIGSDRAIPRGGSVDNNKRQKGTKIKIYCTFEHPHCTSLVP
eukprot:284816806_1